MQIKDYIFYRMYLAYEKHGEDGKFTTVLLFTMIEYFLAFTFTVFLMALVRPESRTTGLITIAIPMIIIFILNCKRYYRKGKLEELKSKFKYSKYNYRIKNWMLYILIPFSPFPGFFILYIISKLFIEK